MLFRSLFLDDAPIDGTPPAPAAAPAVPPAPAPAEATGEIPSLTETFRALRDQVDPTDKVIGTITPQPEGEPPVAEAPAEGAPAEPAAETPAEPAFLVLPPLRDGEEPAELTIDDPVVAERLRDIVGNARSAAELERQSSRVEQLQAELNYVEDKLRLDPVGFLLSTIPKEVRREVALAVLAEEGELEEVGPVLQKWSENPTERKIDRLEAEKARAQRQNEAEQLRLQRNEVRRATAIVTKTVDAVAALVPPDRSALLSDDLLRDVQEGARKNRFTGPLTPDRLIEALAPRLALYGVKIDDAKAAVRSPAARGVPTARPGDEQARKIAEAAADAQRAQERIRKASIARRTAAVAPPPGPAGASPIERMPAENLKRRLDRVRAIHQR